MILPGRTSSKDTRFAHDVPLAVTLVMVLAWVMTLLILGTLSQFDKTCMSCHAMRPYASGSHGVAEDPLTCAACHGSDGAMGTLADGVSMQRRVISTVLRRAVRPSPLRSDSNCRGCHQPVMDHIVARDGIRVRHVDFADASCLDCHGGTAHRLRGRHYAATRMDDCLTCHSTGANSVESCEQCHLDTAVKQAADTPWSVMHGANWRRTHGAGDIDTCASCHPVDFCAKCHGVRIPHLVRWSREHGTSVVSNGSETCRTCHEATWCNDCHGLAMPHPNGFLGQHSRVAQAPDDPACARCHGVDVCRLCHESAHGQLPDGVTPHVEQLR